MDTIENLRALLAIARLKSFTAAAEDLDLAASVVTKRVSQLERTLRAKLLSRSTRKVLPTPDGEHHLPRIAAAVAAYDETVAAVRCATPQHEAAPIREAAPRSRTRGSAARRAVLSSCRGGGGRDRGPRSSVPAFTELEKKSHCETLAYHQDVVLRRKQKVMAPVTITPAAHRPAVAISGTTVPSAMKP